MCAPIGSGAPRDFRVFYRLSEITVRIAFTVASASPTPPLPKNVSQWAKISLNLLPMDAKKKRFEARVREGRAREGGRNGGGRGGREAREVRREEGRWSPCATLPECPFFHRRGSPVHEVFGTPICVELKWAIYRWGHTHRRDGSPACCSPSHPLQRPRPRAR